MVRKVHVTEFAASPRVFESDDEVFRELIAQLLRLSDDERKYHKAAIETLFNFAQRARGVLRRPCDDYFGTEYITPCDCDTIAAACERALALMEERVRRQEQIQCKVSSLSETAHAAADITGEHAALTLSAMESVESYRTRVRQLERKLAMNEAELESAKAELVRECRRGFFVRRENKQLIDQLAEKEKYLAQFHHQYSVVTADVTNRQAENAQVAAELREQLTAHRKELDIKEANVRSLHGRIATLGSENLNAQGEISRLEALLLAAANERAELRMQLGEAQRVIEHVTAQNKTKDARLVQVEVALRQAEAAQNAQQLDDLTRERRAHMSLLDRELAASRRAEELSSEVARLRHLLSVREKAITVVADAVKTEFFDDNR